MGGDMRMSLLYAVLACIPVLSSLLFVGCTNPEDARTPGENEVATAVLETVAGEIEIRFLPEQAPRHVENFINLCESGFYDSTYFHRVAPGVLVQGGDPNTKDDDRKNDGRGGHSFLGSGTTLPSEISDLKHKKGAVSMARGSDLNSAGSQFFIMLREDPLLDGKYTIFAEVVRGIDVVEKIAEEPGEEYPGIGGVNPLKPQTIRTCHIVRKHRDQDIGQTPADNLN
jgi:peptidyl-prolyl cis-trans isomerase B (cyclophilin B)